ncbi:hypothetical protein GQ44DRAFT_654226, partial [Phaeosphaeriaceae sp. PMI808]
LNWARHEVYHVRNPHRIYGPIIIDGIVAAPRRCPYCSTQGIFLQIDNHVQYISHAESHIDKEADDHSLLECPHPPC